MRQKYLAALLGRLKNREQNLQRRLAPFSVGEFAPVLPHRLVESRELAGAIHKRRTKKLFASLITMYRTPGLTKKSALPKT